MELKDRDIILLKRVRKGDKKAFDELFCMYYAPLCVHACRFVEDTDAENIVQDLMLYIWENRRRLEISISLRSYLFTSVRNRALNLIGRSKTKDKVLENIGRSIDFYFLPPSCPLDELETMFNDALQELSPEVREAFLLSRFEGKTYKEIAAGAGVSVKIVDHRIQKAVSHLRARLSGLLPEMA